MSSQRGNVSRTRPQKHQNSRVFKNDLHDKSKKTQMINKITIFDTCDRCKAIIEWKIKYKKYKQLKSAKTCIKCSNKTVKQSYHTICGLCVQNLKVCAKCGTKEFNNNTPSAPLSKSEGENSNQELELSDDDSEGDSDSS